MKEGQMRWEYSTNGRHQKFIHPIKAEKKRPL